MANAKEGTAKKEEKLAELLTAADDHPLMKQILAEKAAAILATRTEAARKIEILKKERDETIPLLLADRDAKEAKYKEAKAALDTAMSEFQTPRIALSSENQTFDTAINCQEQILFESADPALDAAILFLREKLDWLRSPGRISRDARGAKRNIFTEKITLKTESNVDAVRSALDYCRAAIETLGNWKLLPAVDAERITELKTGIPRIDVYTEYTSEKPYGRTIADVNPRMLMPSDSQMDWELAKINERHKEIMGR